MWLTGDWQSATKAASSQFPFSNEAQSTVYLSLE